MAQQTKHAVRHLVIDCIATRSILTARRTAKECKDCRHNKQYNKLNETEIIHSFSLRFDSIYSRKLNESKINTVHVLYAKRNVRVVLDVLSSAMRFGE